MLLCVVCCCLVFVVCVALCVAWSFGVCGLLFVVCNVAVVDCVLSVLYVV